MQIHQAGLASGLEPKDRVPTLLLFGANPAAKSRLLSGWLAERPDGERWAVLRNGAVLPTDWHAPGDPSSSPAGMPSGSGGLFVSHLAGGCACCLGGVAFTTALARLLRAGPWDRLFIEVSPQAQGAVLIDRIRASPLAGRLDLLPAVLVIDSKEAPLPADFDDSQHSLTNQSIELARLLLIPREHASASDPAPIVAPGSAPAPLEPNRSLELIADGLAGRPPWPRRVRILEQGGLPLATLLSDLTASESLHTATGHGFWRWPPSQRFDRRQLQRALADLSGPGAALHPGRLVRLRGVFLTQRDAYSLDATVDPPIWRASAWRLDSRLEVLVRGDFDPNSVSTVLTGALQTP